MLISPRMAGLREPRTAVLISPQTAGLSSPRTAGLTELRTPAGLRGLRMAAGLGDRRLPFPQVGENQTNKNFQKTRKTKRGAGGGAGGGGGKVPLTFVKVCCSVTVHWGRRSEETRSSSEYNLLITLSTVNPSKEHGKTYNSRQETRGRTHYK